MNESLRHATHQIFVGTQVFLFLLLHCVVWLFTVNVFVCFFNLFCFVFVFFRYDALFVSRSVLEVVHLLSMAAFTLRWIERKEKSRVILLSACKKRFL
jgi:hypothetical protein